MSRKADNRRKKAEEQASLFDMGLEPIHIRIRRFVQGDGRRAGWREIAAHFGVTVADVRKAIEPEEKPAAIPCCEAPYCLADGRFAIRKPGWEALRSETPRYYCHSHVPKESPDV